MPAKPKAIRLYPVPGVSLHPYPAEVCDVDAETAEFLLAHVPPPFTTEPTPGSFAAVYEGAWAALTGKEDQTDG